MAFYMIEAQLTDLGLRPLALAAELGLEPVLVTNDVERYAGLGTFGRLVRGQSRILETDTNDADAVHRAIAKDAIAIDAVFTLCDYNLVIAAEVAARFGRPSITPAAARAAVDKLESRRKLSAAGISIPRFHHVLDSSALDRVLGDVGLPCVVKPMTDSASVGVRLCYGARQAHAHVARLCTEPLNARGQRRRPGALVEQYVPGYEVSVETFHLSGETLVLGVTDKHIGGAPAFAEIGEEFPSLLPKTRVDAVADLARSALAAIGHTFGAAHTEIRIAGENAYVIEINGRVGGDDISELVRRSTGFDVLRAAVALAVGHPVEATTASDQTGVAWRALVVQRAGQLTSVSGLDIAARMPGVVEAQVHIPLGAEVSTLSSNHDIVGHVLVEARTAAEAARIADAAVGQVKLGVTACAPDPNVEN